MSTRPPPPHGIPSVDTGSPSHIARLICRTASLLKQLQVVLLKAFFWSHLVRPVRFSPKRVAKVGLEPPAVGQVSVGVPPEVPLPDHVACVARVVHVLREELPCRIRFVTINYKRKKERVG